MAAKAGVAIGILVLAAAILAPRTLTAPTATPGQTAGAIGTFPSEPASTPSASEGAWGNLAVMPFKPLAELLPDDQDRIGIATTASFTLRSLTSTPAVKLARGIAIDPPTDIVIEPGKTPDVARIHPTGRLVAGQRYRIRLLATDGSLVGAWAYIARAPLHLVGTLPGNQAVQVPTNTGIEMTFDQDGVVVDAAHFAIKPAVEGRFETHGRVWAFVPSKALAPGAIYTVTAKHGIGLTGSTETLEHDVTFQFETGVATPTAQRVEFTRSMVELRPDVAPVVTVDAGSVEDSNAPAVTKIGVLVHRLPDFKAVIAAGIALAGPDAWALAAPSATVSTSGLTKVADLDVTIVASTIGSVMTIPVKLPRGAYVVTIKQAGPPAQLLLQVTNLSAYVLTATTSAVAWVNDLSTDTAVTGATVALADGTALGATSADGALTVPTPAKLLATPIAGQDETVPPPARFMTISDAALGSLLVPIGLPVPYGYAGGFSWWSNGGANDWWLLFNTDRIDYRQTDTVHVYGTIRARSDRSVPDGIELRLRPVDGSPDAPIQRVPVVATSRGVFSASVKLDDLPIADYVVDLYVGKQQVSTAWFHVVQISKPAYQLDLQTNHHVYLLGDTIGVDVTASFFDGTAVAGMDLAITGLGQDAAKSTDALGQAHLTFKAQSSEVPEGWFYEAVAAAPTHPEEGQISGELGVIVVPSRVRINGAATLTSGNVVVTGTLNWFDLSGLEAARASGRYLDDPSGGTIAGGTVKAQIIHVVQTREQVGTTYDFIEKRVVPLYDYTESEVTVGTETAKSAGDGTFRISVPAQFPRDSYRVVLTSADPEGRKIQLSLHADAPASSLYQPSQPYLQVPGGCGIPTMQAGLGKDVALTMYTADGKVAPAGRFLFLVSELGSLHTTIQDAATFTKTLRDADLPGFTARAVWLSSTGYKVADVRVDVDPKDKTLTIGLQPDHKAYQPGDPVKIGVTTTDASGHPVAADVVIQGVDQKLYAIGAAYDSDPVSTLMGSVSPGFLGAYLSHDAPSAGPEGCGDTGGEGDRGDFRDSITFQRIRTDTTGHGSVAFTLSDDLTSWHITATAVSAGLDAGLGSVVIPVGLPFFADAVLAPEYLVGDQAVLRLRAYGAGLGTGDNVRFVVSAPSLGLASTTVDGSAFEALRLPLPAMTAGDHAIRIEASGTHGGTSYRDVLIRKVHVVDSRIGTVAASYDPLGSAFQPQGGPGLTTYVITDAGRGRLVPLLRDLASATSARFDRTVAAELARDLLIREFGVPASSLATTGYDVTRYQHGLGIALLPYASDDLFLSARAALVAGSKVDVDQLRMRFEAELDPSGTADPERQITAIAGLAAIGSDVLARLRAFDPSALTIREQLWLAIGFDAAGDEADARSIERALLESHGQRLGAWVRLDVGATLTDTLEASGLLLLLAGRLGDPIANDVSRYLVDHPSTEQVFPLEQLGYVQGMLDRLPKAVGRFAWTIAGERHEVTLEAGGAFTLVLTESQRATLRLETLAGDLAVATTWLASGGDLPADPTIRITRTITPGTDAPENQLVHVKITVAFGAQAPNGCYRLTDLLPSGLAPIVTGAAWPADEGDDGGGETLIGPYAVEGQRVSWCVSPADQSHVFGYAARVVSPGTYRWEPAIVQSEAAPTLGASTSATTYTIR